MKKMKLALILASLGISLNAWGVSQDDFAVYPSVAVINANSSHIYSFMVRNRGAQSLVLKVSPVDLAVADQTAQSSPFRDDTILNNVSPAQFSLDQNVKLSTNYIILQPDQSKMLRVSFSLPPDAIDGTYRLNLNFVPQVPPPSLQKEQSPGDLSFNMNILIAQTISLYVNKGTPDLSLATVQLCQYDPKQGQILLKLSNPTPWVFAPKFNVLSNNKVIAANLSTISLMPMSQGNRLMNDIPLNSTQGLKLAWTATEIAKSSAIKEISCTAM